MRLFGVLTSVLHCLEHNHYSKEWLEINPEGSWVENLRKEPKTNAADT